MNQDSIAHYEAIADGLSENGYVCVDNFLTASEVGAILTADEFKDGLLRFKRAGTGENKKINENVRGDYISWIDRELASPGLVTYLSKISGLISFTNRALFLSLKDYEVHATIYPAGSYYKRHRDQFKSSDHRKLSIICYLNEDWKNEEGGQLRIYLADGHVDIYPVAGRLVCFRSDQIEHEVRPATRDRLSITGWMLDEDAGGPISH